MYAKRAVAGTMVFALWTAAMPFLCEWAGGAALKQKLLDAPFIHNPFYFAGGLLFFASMNIWAYMKKDARRAATKHI